MPRKCDIIVSAEAERNLQEAIDWISISDSVAAERWYIGLMDALQSLSTFRAECPVSPETELCLIDREIGKFRNAIAWSAAVASTSFDTIVNRSLLSPPKHTNPFRPKGRQS